MPQLSHFTRPTRKLPLWWWLLVAMVIWAVFTRPAAAQDPPPPRPAPPVAAPGPPSPPSSPLPNPFGIGWGGGIGYSSNLTAPLVPKGGAFIDDMGFVRITKQEDVKPRILMESHFATRCFSDKIGCGPGIVVQLAGGLTDQLFNAAGGGLIIELGTGPTKFNLIIGALLDFSVDRLRPEYIHGFPSPTAELQFLEKKELSYFVAVAVGR